MMLWDDNDKPYDRHDIPEYITFKQLIHNVAEFIQMLARAVKSRN